MTEIQFHIKNSSVPLGEKKSPTFRSEGGSTDYGLFNEIPTSIPSIIPALMPSLKPRTISSSSRAKIKASSFKVDSLIDGIILFENRYINLRKLMLVPKVLNYLINPIKTENTKH